MFLKISKILKRVIVSSGIFKIIISSKTVKRIIFSSTTFKSFCDKYIYSIEAQWFRNLLEREKINVIIDVGAHAGSTGSYFRGIDFKGRIISFEPIPEMFSLLEKKAKTENLWECYQFALGNETGTKKFHINSNSYTSSFLTESHILKNVEKSLHRVREIDVHVRRLEDLFPEICSSIDSIFLKIDTQGFEKQVIEGVGKYLQYISLVKLEVSLVPLYDNEPLIEEMIGLMWTKGFTPISIQPHASPILHQLQADMIFLNKNKMLSESVYN